MHRKGHPAYLQALLVEPMRAIIELEELIIVVVLGIYV